MKWIKGLSLASILVLIGLLADLIGIFSFLTTRLAGNQTSTIVTVTSPATQTAETNQTPIAQAAVVSTATSLATQKTTLATGDIFQGKNLTLGESTYHDPITASEAQRIRLVARIVNVGSNVAEDAFVQVDLSNSASPVVTIGAANSDIQTDVVGIHNGDSVLSFVPGSARKYGPHNCLNGCELSDDIVSSGVSLGAIFPGETESYQVSVDVDIQPKEPIPMFRSGDIFSGGNRSRGLAPWEDPIQADPGEAVEFQIIVVNETAIAVNNVVVRVELPSAATLSIQPRVIISGSQAKPINDVATVIVSGSIGQFLSYIPGETFKFGPDCTDGCQLPDGITRYGLSLDTVPPGVENSIVITFMTYVSNIVSSGSDTITVHPATQLSRPPLAPRVRVMPTGSSLHFLRNTHPSPQNRLTDACRPSQPLNPRPSVVQSPRSGVVPFAPGRIL